jgi:phage RecT family recombinase
MNAVEPTPPRKQSQVEAFVGEILPENSPVLMNLPAGVDPKRFRNSLHIAVMMQPALLRCEPRLVFREVARIANYGLSLDPSMGEAWLILRKNKNGVAEPQAQLGYRGKIRLARQSGEIARIAAYPVTQKSVTEGRFKVTLHAIHYEPDVFNDDTAPVGYFAYVLYRDGTEDFETMSMREIHKIRDRSDGWRAFKAQKIRSTPWSEFEGEMARKTVLNRLLKRVPMSADVVEFLRQDEEADYLEVSAEDAQPPKPRQTRAEALRAIASQGPEPDEPDNDRPDPAPVLKRGPGRPRKGDAGDARGRTSEHDENARDENHDPVNEPATDEEQDAPESSDVGQSPIDEPDPDEPRIDRKSPDYRRGREDFGAGLKRCLNAEIRAEPRRLDNWRAGWEDAREEADDGPEAA